MQCAAPAVKRLAIIRELRYRKAVILWKREYTVDEVEKAAEQLSHLSTKLKLNTDI